MATEDNTYIKVTILRQEVVNNSDKIIEMSLVDPVKDEFMIQKKSLKLIDNIKFIYHAYRQDDQNKYYWFPGVSLLELFSTFFTVVLFTVISYFFITAFFICYGIRFFYIKLKYCILGKEIIHEYQEKYEPVPIPEHLKFEYHDCVARSKDGVTLYEEYKEKKAKEAKLTKSN